MLEGIFLSCVASFGDQGRLTSATELPLKSPEAEPEALEALGLSPG